MSHLESALNKVDLIMSGEIVHLSDDEINSIYFEDDAILFDEE